MPTQEETNRRIIEALEPLPQVLTLIQTYVQTQHEVNVQVQIRLDNHEGRLDAVEKWQLAKDVSFGVLKWAGGAVLTCATLLMAWFAAGSPHIRFG